MLKMNEDELLELKDENERIAWEDELRAAPVTEAMPVHLTLETTMKCNMSCIMCQVHRNPALARKADVANSVMPWELFEKLAKETFPTAKEMSPTVMGEPLLTSYFDKMLEIIGAYRVKMNIVTNGMMLTRDVSERMMPHLNKIKVSFDGAKKATYEKIRRGADFDRIVGNIRSFNQVREEYSGDERPTLIFQVTLMRDNIEELPEIVEIASELGVDMIVGLHVYVFEPEFQNQSLLNHQEISDGYLLDAISRAKELGVEPHLPMPFNSEPDPTIETMSSDYIPRRCKFLWREVWIGNKGDVTPCCVPDRPVMGNLHQDPFQDIWKGQLYRAMRERLNSNNPFPLCDNCSLAVQYEPKLNYRYQQN